LPTRVSFYSPISPPILVTVRFLRVPPAFLYSFPSLSVWFFFFFPLLRSFIPGSILCDHYGVSSSGQPWVVTARPLLPPPHFFFFPLVSLPPRTYVAVTPSPFSHRSVNRKPNLLTLAPNSLHCLSTVLCALILHFLYCFCKAEHLPSSCQLLVQPQPPPIAPECFPEKRSMLVFFLSTSLVPFPARSPIGFPLSFQSAKPASQPPPPPPLFPSFFLLKFLYFFLHPPSGACFLVNRFLIFGVLLAPPFFIPQLLRAQAMCALARDYVPHKPSSF